MVGKLGVGKLLSRVAALAAGADAKRTNDDIGGAGDLGVFLVTVPYQSVSY